METNKNKDLVKSDIEVKREFGVYVASLNFSNSTVTKHYVGLGVTETEARDKLIKVMVEHLNKIYGNGKTEKSS